LLGDAEVLVIDALDEVSAQREGDAVDHVLRKLGELGYPRFRDWRSYTVRSLVQPELIDDVRRLITRCPRLGRNICMSESCGRCACYVGSGRGLVHGHSKFA
jgi:hypothetical protein